MITLLMSCVSWEEGKGDVEREEGVDGSSRCDVSCFTIDNGFEGRDFCVKCLVFVSVVMVDRTTSASSIASESKGATRMKVGGQSGYNNGP